MRVLYISGWGWERFTAFRCMVLGEGVGLGHQSSMQRTSERAIEGGSALDFTFSHILSFAILDQQQSSALLLLGREMLAI